MKYTPSNVRGFSLIELMVALSIFSIVMTVSIGTLLVLIDANGKAQALSSAMTNLAFAIDSVTRNIRTGRNYYCTSTFTSGALPSGSSLSDCNGETGIVFTPGDAPNDRMAYRLYNGAIQQRIDEGGVGSSADWVDITSTEPPAAVTIEDFDFIVEGTDGAIDTTDDTQANLALIINGYVNNGLSEPTRFQVQSKVTQRVLNY
jgi:prepilin-type N-terminal cleavage/methylation domain-containing protein